VSSIGGPIEPLRRTSFTIVQVRMALPDGSDFERPFILKEGRNEFACFATHIDGTEVPFDAYWTCPLFERDGGVQNWSVLGTARRHEVAVSASARHERYHELACWVFKPDGELRAALGDVPRDSTAFDYSAFE
jgi:hypothetical protein